MTKRWRKVLDSGTEVVNYDLDGVTVQQYAPDGQYFAIGEFVELPVRVNVYQSKAGIRYNPVHATKVEGGF